MVIPHTDYFSNCCGSHPIGPLFHDEDGTFGMCSRCRDHAGFDWLPEYPVETDQKEVSELIEVN